MAVESKTENCELFGSKRPKIGRSFTALGTDTSDVWRKEINDRYFKPFFEQMLNSGLKHWQSTTTGEEWVLTFELLKNTAGNTKGMRDELMHFDDELEATQVIESLRDVFHAFPKMKDYPSLNNTNIAVLKITFRGVHLCTYLLAIEAGSSDDFKERARIALKNFSHDNGGPFTGTLIVHSPEDASSALADAASRSFGSFLKGVKIGAPITQLMRNLALFRWSRSHAIEFARGSAAIAEWLEQALVMSAGYTLTRDAGWDKLCDGMAFSLPPKEFVIEYSKHTQLIGQSSSLKKNEEGAEAQKNTSQSEKFLALLKQKPISELPELPGSLSALIGLAKSGAVLVFKDKNGRSRAFYKGEKVLNVNSVRIIAIEIKGALIDDCEWNYDINNYLGNYAEITSKPLHNSIVDFIQETCPKNNIHRLSI